MFNIFKKPYEKGTLEAWAKTCDDIAKVAILAVPVILYNNDPLLQKGINLVALVISTYSTIWGARICRKLAENKED
ncbi:hypothetical protein ACLSZ3_00080 [Avibacterium gallinarum]|uniref:hypothetical protein n=1 Tax=Avibacterium gallinarum TaxID=755 RepID=UPI003BF88DBC